MHANFHRQTILDGAMKRADEHKWIRSLEANRDLGPSAIKEWVDRYWIKYVKGCFYEHVRGEYLYEEFNEASYNILQVFTFRTPSLRSRIETLLREGKENLDIINWAIDAGEDLDDVIAFMERADVNACRLPCPLVELTN